MASHGQATSVLDGQLFNFSIWQWCLSFWSLLMTRLMFVFCKKGATYLYPEEGDVGCCCEGAQWGRASPEVMR